MSPGDAVKGADQPREILARLHRPDGQHVTVHPRGEEGEPARRRRPGAGAKVRDARPYGSHPRGIRSEDVYHLVCDVLRVGVDPGPQLDGSLDEVAKDEGRRLAQLGILDRREVVHGDDTRRGGGGRYHEVGPVHDVRRTQEPFGWRPSEPKPGPADRPAGHRPAPNGNVRRHLGPHLVELPPGNGEGGHVDRGPARQRRQQAAAELADPTFLAHEQRGGIDTHTDARHQSEATFTGIETTAVGPKCGAAGRKSRMHRRLIRPNVPAPAAGSGTFLGCH
jgi:hypothetical protein